MLGFQEAYPNTIRIYRIEYTVLIFERHILSIVLVLAWISVVLVLSLMMYAVTKAIPALMMTASGARPKCRFIDAIDKPCNEARVEVRARDSMLTIRIFTFLAISCNNFAFFNRHSGQLNSDSATTSAKSWILN